jgi:hypothetical protein
MTKYTSFLLFTPSYFYACRKISPSFVYRYKYTLVGQPAVARGGGGSDSAWGVLLLSWPFHLSFPSCCDLAQARRYFASSILYVTGEKRPPWSMDVCASWKILKAVRIYEHSCVFEFKWLCLKSRTILVSAWSWFLHNFVVMCSVCVSESSVFHFT